MTIRPSTLRLGTLAFGLSALALLALPAHAQEAQASGPATTDDAAIVIDVPTGTAVESAAEADRVFSMLMGDEVAPRREFIESHAKYARIDV